MGKYGEFQKKEKKAGLGFLFEEKRDFFLVSLGFRFQFEHWKLIFTIISFHFMFGLWIE